MSMMWREIGEEERSIMQWLRSDVFKLQQTIIEISRGMLGGVHLGTIWFLLGEAERRRHIFEGLHGACKLAAWGQDARALCPEITVSGLLRDNGRAFSNFLDYYTNMKRLSTDDILLLPSSWWNQALDGLPRPLTEKEVFAYECLTLNRNEFIAYFFVHTLESIRSDIVRGRGMSSVVNVTENMSGTFGRDTTEAIKVKRLVRCENCDRTPKDLGDNIQFLVCGRCKTKLDFSLHYCSRKCQREDWSRHKNNCGKKRVSKFLPESAGGSSWSFHQTHRLAHDIPISPNGNASLPFSGAGQPHYHRSPALQLQLAMIERDQDADYFLFSSSHQPIRFAIHDTWTKMVFRLLRQGSVSSANKQGVEAMAEYMIKAMGRMPGLSREIILKQLSAEYGDDTEAKLMEFERKSIENGTGLTFLEDMSRNMVSMAPILFKS
ncbi:hypothetical protein SERLA73DRAFT_174578 [Serpula lacrymans var. lacrymans S7.3]|uniref:MYND-type domain-containing protein n=2 Tax=Serpula lacrymans var. lacrymans TaxID=341189 RepID=F8PGJ8_SERL3|nr:uncharacterized protein SERLADRAFT_456174 [Serpula lacrymans var. lacrymans S7.9]EGO05431.1 hypothetical protein SERLA73DRAFT_174578 [Serpula lacrymans var. lacrymans S7.3]EGO31278.1 hypothetical protein SERLADRAFT_456174 [Serpula lacrymans var. lacrymans S7.9]